MYTSTIEVLENLIKRLNKRNEVLKEINEKKPKSYKNDIIQRIIENELTVRMLENEVIVLKNIHVYETELSVENLEHFKKCTGKLTNI